MPRDLKKELTDEGIRWKMTVWLCEDKSLLVLINH